jgi:hypothetical protein
LKFLQILLNVFGHGDDVPVDPRAVFEILRVLCNQKAEAESLCLLI